MLIITPQIIRDNLALITVQKIGERNLSKESVETFAYDLETWVGLLHKRLPRIDKETLNIKLLELVENQEFVPSAQGFNLSWDRHEKLLREML